MSAPSVGLVMIVKDEEAVIERALRSARPYISTWVIVDTGSTDRTKEIIQRFFADISGLLVDRPWVNFGHNRSEALALCDGRMDWAIMLDADDNLVGAPPSADIWTHANVDVFMMSLRHGPIHHRRLQIFRTGIGWGYEGVIHEIPVCRSKTHVKAAVLPDSFYMETRCEGVRSRDPLKYLNDAIMLEKIEQKDPRTLFYLAQSYRDAGIKAKAEEVFRTYLQTPGAGGEERYIVLMNLIDLVEKPEDQLAFAWEGFDLAPKRLEVQYCLVKRRRVAGLKPTQQIYALCAASSNRVLLPDISYVNPLIYDWAFDDEFSVVAFETGHYKESYEASIRVALTAPDMAIRMNALENAKKARGLYT